MPRSRLPAISRALIAALASACGASEPAAPGWVPLTETAAIRVSLDTARVDAAGGRRQVWLTFDLAEPWPPMDDIKAPYRHYEARQDVDCAGRRARGLAMRFVDVQWTTYTKPAPDSTWTAFPQHPLTENLFRPLCAKLAALGDG